MRKSAHIAVVASNLFQTVAMVRSAMGDATSKEVQACPEDCEYSGEDPGHRCFRRWSSKNKNLMPHMYCMYVYT